jgi:hypothetical protein
MPINAPGAFTNKATFPIVIIGLDVPQPGNNAPGTQASIVIIDLTANSQIDSIYFDLSTAGSSVLDDVFEIVHLPHKLLMPSNSKLTVTAFSGVIQPTKGMSIECRTLDDALAIL